jgi:hypothetical protein
MRCRPGYWQVRIRGRQLAAAAVVVVEVEDEKRFFGDAGSSGEKVRQHLRRMSWPGKRDFGGAVWAMHDAVFRLCRLWLIVAGNSGNFIWPRSYGERLGTERQAKLPAPNMSNVGPSLATTCPMARRGPCSRAANAYSPGKQHRETFWPRSIGPTGAIAGSRTHPCRAVLCRFRNFRPPKHPQRECLAPQALAVTCSAHCERDRPVNI